MTSIVICAVTQSANSTWAGGLKLSDESRMLPLVVVIQSAANLARIITSGFGFFIFTAFLLNQNAAKPGAILNLIFYSDFKQCNLNSKTSYLISVRYSLNVGAFCFESNVC